MQPKLRDIQTSFGQYEGQPYIMLRDPLGLSKETVSIPQTLAPLLGLCDGTRDQATLRTAFELRTGIPLSATVLEQVISRLDEALLLDNERFAQARDAALSEFRAAPARSPALAGRSYPADPDELKNVLRQYLDAVPKGTEVADSSSIEIRGLISPHIDFQRGEPVYAQVWSKARETIPNIKLVIIFGTDHLGGHNPLTLTMQNYSTPWGILPTAQDVVAKVASALGNEVAFEDELHHKSEHSIELAVVWLHYFLGDRQCELVPILCGSFEQFIIGDEEPSRDQQIAAVIDSLRDVMESRRTLVVASADLAHVGPAFGDQYPADIIQRSRNTTADERLIEAMCAADAEGFFAQIKRERNERRICGLAPIYLSLRLLGEAQGKAFGYTQCPADEVGASLVSICGVVLG